MTPACLALAILLSAHPEPTGRPDWCQKGFVCLPTAIAADQEATIRERDATIADLQAELVRLKAKGCGAGLRWYAGAGAGVCMPLIERQDGSTGVERLWAPTISGGFAWTWK